jgi:hypothetical protein
MTHYCKRRPVLDNGVGRRGGVEGGLGGGAVVHERAPLSPKISSAWPPGKRDEPQRSARVWTDHSTGVLAESITLFQNRDRPRLNDYFRSVVRVHSWPPSWGTAGVV